jgi:hypothetical protein
MFLGELIEQIVSVFVINQQCDEDTKMDIGVIKKPIFGSAQIMRKSAFQNDGIGTKTMLMIEEMLKNDGMEAKDWMRSH